MQKLLIYWVCGASVLLGGCETLRNWGDAVPKALDELPLMYRQDIQQGNVIDQEMVNQLRPGMAKRQVRFILGTPILVDVFHQDRWDYLYSMKQGRQPRDQERISLYFEDDKLVRIEGDYRPMPKTEETGPKKEIVVSVPDYEPKEKGLFARTLEKIGIKDEEE